jgi:hypothetical protein
MNVAAKFAGFVSAIFASVVMVQSAAASGTEAMAEQVRQTVVVKLTDESPVAGVKVFDNSTNQLLGVTDESGSVEVTTIIGAVLRIVEPGYGVQQALRTVQAAPSDGWTNRAAAVISKYWVIG